MSNPSTESQALYALQASGLVVDSIEVGRIVRCKTEGGKHGSRDGWYWAFDDGGVVYGNWRNPDQIGHWQPQGAQPIDRAAIERAKAERRAALAKEWARNSQRLTNTWEAAKPVQDGGLISQYLTSRGLALPDGEALRGTRLGYWEDGQHLGDFTCMVAAVTAPEGHTVSLHRTYIGADRRKAAVAQSKKLMASAGRMAGAAIRLMEHGSRLGIAEGIETALSASVLFDVSCWAAVSAHGLASWQPPEGVMTVDIFSDNDSNGVGQEAASRLAQRLAINGLEVRIQTPELIGDWNDVLMESGK